MLRESVGGWGKEYGERDEGDSVVKGFKSSEGDEGVSRG